MDVLDGVEQLHAPGNRALEGLAPADEAQSPGPLVDHRGAHRLGGFADPLLAGIAPRGSSWRQ